MIGTVANDRLAHLFAVLGQALTESLDIWDTGLAEDIEKDMLLLAPEFVPPDDFCRYRDSEAWTAWQALIDEALGQ